MNTNERRKDSTDESAIATTATRLQVVEGRNLTVDDVLAEVMDMLPLLRDIKRSSQDEPVGFENGDFIWRTADNMQRRIEALAG